MAKMNDHLEMDVQHQHPLKIKEVLEHILEFCPLNDLKQCRLVSTFWRDSAAKSFKSFPVKLTSSTKTREFIRTLKDPRPIAGSRPKLYSNLHLSNSSLMLSRQSYALWALAGPNINYLELSDIKLRCTLEFRLIVLHLCPNLKELTLRQVSLARPPIQNIIEPEEWVPPEFGENKNVRKLTTNINQVAQSLGLSWMEFINFFPSLNALHLEESRPTHYVLFKALQISREHDPGRFQLTEMNFADQIALNCHHQLFVNISAFELLEKTNLKMKKLSISLNGGTDSRAVNLWALVEIVERQRNTLEKLTIKRNLGENLDPVYFVIMNSPIFEKLQELELASPVFTSMWFLKFMPNLKKLAFCQPNFTADPRIPLESDLSGVQLKKLVELSVNCKVSMEGLEILFNLFPNVERLLNIMGLDNDMFRLVCERWPKLVELYIVDSRVDDCGITGLDEHDVKKINDLCGKSKFRANTDRRANLTSLKHLRKFLMHAYSSLFSNVLGYCAMQYGFKETANLEDLSLINYAVEKKAYKQIMLAGNRKIRTLLVSPIY